MENSYYNVNNQSCVLQFKGKSLFHPMSKTWVTSDIRQELVAKYVFIKQMTYL